MSRKYKYNPNGRYVIDKNVKNDDIQNIMRGNATTKERKSLISDPTWRGFVSDSMKEKRIKGFLIALSSAAALFGAGKAIANSSSPTFDDIVKSQAQSQLPTYDEDSSLAFDIAKLDSYVQELMASDTIPDVEVLRDVQLKLDELTSRTAEAVVVDGFKKSHKNCESVVAENRYNGKVDFFIITYVENGVEKTSVVDNIGRDLLKTFDIERNIDDDFESMILKMQSPDTEDSEKTNLSEKFLKRSSDYVGTIKDVATKGGVYVDLPFDFDYVGTKNQLKKKNLTSSSEKQISQNKNTSNDRDDR